MLLRKLVVGTNHRTLEQAPDAFDAVCVNLTTHPFFAVAYDVHDLTANSQELTANS